MFHKLPYTVLIISILEWEIEKRRSEERKGERKDKAKESESRTAKTQ